MPWQPFRPPQGEGWGVLLWEPSFPTGGEVGGHCHGNHCCPLVGSVAMKTPLPQGQKVLGGGVAMGTPLVGG